jgi:YidC/Oxa1 family membrane protein insertase
MANMRKLPPRLAKLKETYGDDKQKMGQKTMELYKQEKVNPVSGCLPIMVQIPVACNAAQLPLLQSCRIL